VNAAHVHLLAQLGTYLPGSAPSISRQLAGEHSAAAGGGYLCCRRVLPSIPGPAHGGRLDGYGFQHSTGLAGNVAPERRGRCHRN